MAYETAHVVADHRGGIARTDAETVVESAASVPFGHYGPDSSVQTFPYVAGWAKDRAVLMRNLAAIQQTSHAIIRSIEELDRRERGGERPKISGIVGVMARQRRYNAMWDGVARRKG